MNSKNLITNWAAYAPYLKSLLRIATAIMFLESGSINLFAFPHGVPPDGGTVELMSQVGIGAILEFFGGALLLLGLFTRPVAFVLAGEMAVAYFQFHFPGSVWPSINHGTSAILYCFIWLYISASGAGPWSLDEIQKK